MRMQNSFSISGDDDGLRTGDCSSLAGSSRTDMGWVVVVVVVRGL
jgi:hypothetical protein